MNVSYIKQSWKLKKKFSFKKRNKWIKIRKFKNVVLIVSKFVEK